MNNRKTGNYFEQELCELLFEKGFWVHNLAQNQAGQPADIIAVICKTAYLIDAKVCADDTFKFSRIEANQESAMDLWRDCGNGSGWFALFIRGEVWLLSYSTIERAKAILEKTQITYDELLEYGVPLEEWVEKCKIATGSVDGVISINLNAK